METNPAQIGRRGFLGALARLAPAVALATAASPVAAATPTSHENPRLLRLEKQIAAAEVAHTAAVARKAEARAAADRQWPALPAAITFEPGVREPHWCGVQAERDIDDKTVWPPDGPGCGRYRRVACAYQLGTYVRCADGRKREARDARKLLAIVSEYEAARDAVIEATGYGQAKDDLYALTDRISRITDLIYKCPAKTYQGLTIKAHALIVGVSIVDLDNCISHRSKVLYAEALAREILAVGRASP